MAVGSGTPYNIHTGTGAAVAFAYSFTLLDAADLVVTVDGVATTSYSVLGIGNAGGGLVTLSAAPANGAVVILRRVVDLVRSTDYQNNGDLLAPTLNGDFDRLWMAVQQTEAGHSSFIRAPFPEALGNLPGAVDRANLLLGFGSDGAPMAVAPTSGSAAALALDIASTASATKGAGQLGYNPALNYVAATAGWGLRSAGTRTNALRYIPVSEWAAVLAGTSTTDLTAYLQAGIDAESGLFLPQGRWTVSATVGLRVRDGTAIVGAGKNRTIIWAALGTGGTVAQLAAYTAGAVIRRVFSPGVANAYISGCVFEDFGIILNHPAAAITTTAIQIGIDLRNITRSNVNRVHVGNYAPSGSFVVKGNPPNGYAQQGYGVITGNVPSSDPAYCGGEVHTISETQVWGAYKLIAQDDSTLSPSSSAHAVTVSACDLQGGHHCLVQESQYTAGVNWIDNTVQNCVKQSGNASPSYVAHFAGYGSVMHGGYIEAGSGADYLLLLDTASSANAFRLTYYSATTAAAITDLGTRNSLEYRRNTGSLPGGVDSFGAPIRMHAKAPLAAGWKGFWNGSAFVVSASDGMTIIRNGVGDYTLRLSTAQPNTHWTASVLIDTDVSGHGGMVSMQAATQSATDLRFFTWSQNAGASTLIDPRMMLVSAQQTLA